MMRRMKTLHTLFAAAALGLTATPVLAALDRGAQAPGFTAPGALAGKPIRVDLRTSLKQGPVVLYFFPAALPRGAISKRRPLPPLSTSSARPGPRSSA